MPPPGGRGGGSAQPPAGRGRGGASAQPPAGRGGGRGGGSAQPPAGRGRGGASAQPPAGRGRGASASLKVPIFRSQQAVRFKARKSRRGRSVPGPSKGRPQSPPCQDHVAEQAPVSCSCKLASSGRCISLSPGPTILERNPPDWYLTFYIRMDRSESFRAYPHVGGPFKSLQEADNAIDCHLRGREAEKMRKDSLDKLSPREQLIQRALYWPDGSRKRSASENIEAATDHLVEALVDKYNEDHELFGDRALEIKGAVHSQLQWESETNIWYYHFNFTTKTKEGGLDNLFFAEVTCMKGDELAVSCFCMINTDANGWCYGCTNNGSVGMKHPNEANAYNAGHPDNYLPFGHSGVWDASDDSSDDDVENFKDEETRIRYHYKSLGDTETLFA